MMMAEDDGLLSQDEIDALTKGLMGGGDDTAEESNSSDGAFDPETPRDGVKLIADQSSSVVSTVLGKEVEFRVISYELATIEQITEGFDENTLVVKSHFTGDVGGNVYSVISKKSTAVLADLMMMGDGQVEFEEDHQDALSELFNQIMGSVSTTFSSEMGLKAEISQAELIPWDMTQPPMPLEGGVVVKAELKVNGFPDEPVRWLCDSGFVEAFQKDLMDESALPGGDSDLGAPSSAPSGNFGPSAQMLISGSSGGGGSFSSTGNKALDLLLDIELPITIELGQTEMSLKRILDLGPGSIVELDRMFGEPVDLMINGKVVAKGEVVVVDENFGIRIVSLVSPEERLKMLK